MSSSEEENQIPSEYYNSEGELDIEGFEKDVLDSARRSLENSRGTGSNPSAREIRLKNREQRRLELIRSVNMDTTSTANSSSATESTTTTTSTSQGSTLTPEGQTSGSQTNTTWSTINQGGPQNITFLQNQQNQFGQGPGGQPPVAGGSGQINGQPLTNGAGAQVIPGLNPNNLNPNLQPAGFTPPGINLTPGAPNTIPGASTLPGLNLPPIPAGNLDINTLFGTMASHMTQVVSTIIQNTTIEKEKTSQLMKDILQKPREDRFKSALLPNNHPLSHLTGDVPTPENEFDQGKKQTKNLFQKIFRFRAKKIFH